MLPGLVAYSELFANNRALYPGACLYPQRNSGAGCHDAAGASCSAIPARADLKRLPVCFQRRISKSCWTSGLGFGTRSDLFCARLRRRLGRIGTLLRPPQRQVGNRIQQCIGFYCAVQIDCGHFSHWWKEFCCLCNSIFLCFGNPKIKTPIVLHCWSCVPGIYCVCVTQLVWFVGLTYTSVFVPRGGGGGGGWSACSEVRRLIFQGVNIL